MAIATAPFLDIERNLAVIQRQWPALLALCDDAATFAANASAVSGWGVAKQVHHVGIENTMIADAIEEMLAHPEQGAGLGPTHPYTTTLFEKGRMPRGGGQAPQELHPPDALDRRDTRALIESARAKWDAVSKKRTAFPSNTATHPHPILGPFTIVHWLRFIPIHTAHHLKIVRDILSAGGLAAPFGLDVENVG